MILRRNVEKLGTAGDTVKVAAGYARNYLVPRGLAYPATGAAASRVAQERKAQETRLERAREDARRAAGKLEAVSVTFVERAGDEDQLYGSVGAERIAEKLAELGHPVERRHVQLEEPIKALGVYNVEVKLHPDAVANVKIWVVEE
ncbi:MAG: 50S ribosomal protein L9 [Gemmatimonadota bacterium]